MEEDHDFRGCGRRHQKPARRRVAALIGRRSGGASAVRRSGGRRAVPEAAPVLPESPPARLSRPSHEALLVLWLLSNRSTVCACAA